MIQSLQNIIPILLLLLLGMRFGKQVAQNFRGSLGKLSEACLCALLVLMGISIGRVNGIAAKLSEVGLSALLVAAASCAGTACVIHATRMAQPEVKQDSSDANSFNAWHYAKDPLTMLSLVMVGFVLPFAGLAPDLDYDLAVTVCLYVLIMLIGIRLSETALGFRDVLLNRRALIVATATMIGTYSGVAVLGWVRAGHPLEYIATASGFGWYTLSGIMITQLGDPILGSTAFFADVFREIFALILTPVLARHGRAATAIGIGGATCMDVTLPILEKHCVPRDVQTGFASGAVLTILVPFLIPLAYSMSASVRALSTP